MSQLIAGDTTMFPNNSTNYANNYVYYHPLGCRCRLCNPYITESATTIYLANPQQPDLERLALEQLAEAVRNAKTTRTAEVQRALDLLDGIKELLKR